MFVNKLFKIKFICRKFRTNMYQETR